MEDGGPYPPQQKNEHRKKAAGTRAPQTAKSPERHAGRQALMKADRPRFPEEGQKTPASSMMPVGARLLDIGKGADHRDDADEEEKVVHDALLCLWCP